MFDETDANLADTLHGGQWPSRRNRDVAPSARCNFDDGHPFPEYHGGPRHIGESLRKVLTKLTGDDPERRTLVARVLGVAASQKGER